MIASTTAPAGPEDVIAEVRRWQRRLGGNLYSLFPYAVSARDQTISPDLERFLATRMKATTVELSAGHLSLVSHGREIAEMILAAAGRGR